MRKSEWIVIGLTALALAAAAIVLPLMPAEVASHWNAAGQVDDTMPRFWGVFLTPFIMIGTSLLFIAIPRIDPLKHNIATFIRYYDGFIVLMTIFMLFVFGQIVLWNLGIQVPINIVMLGGLALIIYYSAILMERAKRNWFIGIRTPWTLSSDHVWDKTHKIGARLFKILAVLILVSAFLPGALGVYVILIGAFGVAGFLIIYSYVEYQREMAAS